MVCMVCMVCMVHIAVILLLRGVCEGCEEIYQVADRVLQLCVIGCSLFLFCIVGVGVYRRALGVIGGSGSRHTVLCGLGSGRRSRGGGTGGCRRIHRLTGERCTGPHIISL